MEIVYTSTKDHIDAVLDDQGTQDIHEINLPQEEYDEVLFGLNKNGTDHAMAYPVWEGGPAEYRGVCFNLKVGE